MPGTVTHRRRQPGRVRRRAPSSTTTNDLRVTRRHKHEHVSTVRPMASTSDDSLREPEQEGGQDQPAVVTDGQRQQRTCTADDGSARSVVEVVAEELGASLRRATATPSRA